MNIEEELPIYSCNSAVVFDVGLKENLLKFFGPHASTRVCIKDIEETIVSAFLKASSVARIILRLRIVIAG